MHQTLRRLGVALVLLLVLPVGACTSSPAAPPQAHVRSLPGGCSGTVVTDSEPPVWSQTGFSHTNGTPWPVPWALGKPGDAVAFLFSKQLVAGGSPRVDGTNNKVGWSVKDKAVDYVVEGRPFGQSQPVVVVKGGPSIEEVPTPGCWTFRVILGAHKDVGSTINLEVLPAGTLPAK